MNPNVNEVHIDQVLTNISVAYLQASNAFIARRVFPSVPVMKKSDTYYTFNKNDFKRLQMQRRGPGQESAGGGFRVNTATYSCDVWALHIDLDHQTRANYDNPLNPDRNNTQYLTQQALMTLDSEWADAYFKPSVWGTDYTGVASGATSGQFIQWSNQSASDPIRDVELARMTILENTGFKPNKFVIGAHVFSALKQHPDIIDRIKYTSAEIITPQLLARLFEVDEVIVPEGIYATNVEGAQSEGYDFIFGKGALLVYANPSPALEMPSGGYTIEWTGVSQGLGEAVGVSQFYIPETKSWRYEIEMAWDHHLVAQDVGAYFATAVA